MSEADIQRFLGKKVCVKYSKLKKPVTGCLETIVAGCAIINSGVGIYGMYPHFMEDIHEVLL
jgi:hypothetical protein